MSGFYMFRLVIGVELLMDSGKMLFGVLKGIV